ncbi:MAG: hypothetical protein Q4E51_09630 [Lachnospiraceae bacterium]|nr:hypothetical protein [Lachnospiraceae bacterium]MDO4966950.1 hypothetical protein [Lachnospiraceae bacterium]
MEKVEADEKLIEKVKSIDEKYPEMTAEKMAAIISLAKELDITITEEDFQLGEEGELDDDALSQVAGGAVWTRSWKWYDESKDCFKMI